MNEQVDPTPPPGVDPSIPSAARLYDVYLGGKDNYASDRQAAETLLTQVPELQTMAKANRQWMRRIVTHLAAEQGVRQFIDIGSGLPSQDSVHEVARRHRPDARVLYVDNDPIVRAHADALLADDPDHTGVVDGDLRDPAAVLDHPEAQRLIDFTQPVAVLLVAVLHFIRDSDKPFEAVRTLRDALPAGSYIAISHVENETAPEQAALLEAVYARTSAPGQTRGHAEVTRFFDGMELSDPGVVHISDWRPEFGDKRYPPEQAWGYGGLARVTEH